MLKMSTFLIRKLLKFSVTEPLVAQLGGLLQVTEISVEVYPKTLRQALV